MFVGLGIVTCVVLWLFCLCFGFLCMISLIECCYDWCLIFVYLLRLFAGFVVYLLIWVVCVSSFVYFAFCFCGLFAVCFC